MSLMVSPTINLIRMTHHSCERKEYNIKILGEHCIITHSHTLNSY